MNPNDQPPRTRAELLLALVLRQPVAERAAFLDHECAGDAALRSQIEARLAQDLRLGGGLISPAAAEAATIEMELPGITPGEAIGQTIGRYKLLEQVGEGGYGVVYVAEQSEPIRRRVALKVIKLGMDTKAVVARFEAERQALAMMDHPNIAKVLDAGVTETGRPYFVMELVRGIKITEYCDQNNLPTHERLELFVDVCHAIQHAHQKGIIHRDIKPSNILVTLHDGVPIPKVIDFGIAKATEGRLTDATIYTQLHQFIGTPAYMSPEQAEMSGLDIDTRSDIYSLGVLLYELLTGRTPFDAKELIASGIEAMRKTIREKEPVRPSTRLGSLKGEELTTTAKRRAAEVSQLVSLLAGDLDWIVMKCLEKDRTRRYETANGVAADVERHFKHEPVVARPPSAAYRFQKMVRRNRTAFAGAAIVALALIVGFGAALVGFIQAVQAKQKETKLRQQAQAQELASRRRAYAAEMNTAYRSFAENNLGHVLQMLDRQRPKRGEEDLRGFEWRYLWQRARGSELMNWPEGSDAYAYSPDGKLLACSFTNIVVRDAKTKGLIIKLPAGASSLSFSPDSRLLASGDSDNTLIWDTRSWRQVGSLPGARYPVRFSPDGRFLLTGNPNGYCLWDTESWQAVGLAAVESPSSGGLIQNLVAFSPDGQYLLTPWGGGFLQAHQIRVWRVPAMQELVSFETGDPLQAGAPSALAFSADGSRVIMARMNGQVVVWDFPGRTMVRTWTAHPSHIICIGISANGKWLATGSNDHTVRWWDLASYEQVAKLGVHIGEVWSLAVSPDGREVVARGRFPPETRIWSTSARDTEAKLDGADSVWGFVDHGRLLVGCTTNDLVIWDPREGTQLHVPIFDTADVGDYNWRSVLRPDNSVVAVGRSDGTIEFWSLASGTKVSTWQAHQDGIYALGFSADSRTLASGTRGGEVRVWDAATHAELSQFDPLRRKIFSFAFSPNGQMLAASGSFGVVVWELASRKEIIRSDCGGCEAPVTVFSPDGKLLAVTALQLNEVHLWDPITGTRVAVLKGLIGGASILAFSPDGLTLASSGNQVKLWNVPTLQEVATIAGDGYQPWGLAFSPDGLALAVAYAKPSRRTFLWRAPSLEEIDRMERRE